MPQLGAEPWQGRLAKAAEEGNATEEEAEKQEEEEKEQEGEEEEEEERVKEEEVEVVVPCTLPPGLCGCRDCDAVGAWA